MKNKLKLFINRPKFASSDRAFCGSLGENSEMSSTNSRHISWVISVCCVKIVCNESFIILETRTL